ncbi:hypothetical protein S245_027152, partial [Arachis hypogaea]
VRKTLNSELWHACAGPLVSLPQVEILVYYLPQEHSEKMISACPAYAKSSVSFLKIPIVEFWSKEKEGSKQPHSENCFTRFGQFSRESADGEDGMVIKMDGELWQSLESCFVSIILALSSADQAKVLTEWLENECIRYPDLTEAFEVQCCRSKIRFLSNELLRTAYPKIPILVKSRHLEENMNPFFRLVNENFGRSHLNLIISIHYNSSISTISGSGVMDPLLDLAQNGTDRGKRKAAQLLERMSMFLEQ